MPNNVSIDELKAKAKELRLHIAQTTFNATSGHIGGSLSSTDMLIALYFKYLKVDPANPDWDERDRFIMSKGHCALAYVPCLAMRGFLDLEEVMKNFNKTESRHTVCTPTARRSEAATLPPVRSDTVCPWASAWRSASGSRTSTARWSS